MAVQDQAVTRSSIVQRSPIFYGWVVWFVATIGLFATTPGQSFSISLFIDHYIVDFNLDRTTVSGLFGLGTFISALSLTWIGRQIDRAGNRRMSVIVSILFAITLVLSALISGPIMILFSFVAVRGFGQGALGLVNSTAIANWYQRRRGLMVGLTLVAYSLFQRVYQPWMQSFIAINGWRMAWLVSGLVIAAFILPLLYIFLRDRPEQFGLRPDGDTQPLPKHTAPPIEENWRLSEAQHTLMFWVFAAGRVMAGAWVTALILHQISMFQDVGFSAQFATETYGQVSLITGAFTLVSGWLVSRARPGYLIAIQMFSLAGTLAMMRVMSSPLEVWLYSIMFGMTMGVGAVFDGTVWVTLFGRKHQGAIRGFIATMLVTGTSFGPLVYGMAHDQSGSYNEALILTTLICLIVGGLALIVPKPKPHPTTGAD